MAVPAIDRAYARANLYRFLSLAFAYPTRDLHAELLDGCEPALAAARLVSPEVAALAEEATSALRSRERSELASEHRKSFTLSASPDCPLNEAAYSAKHVYQEVQELADIAGFYRAFGLEIAGERPDELAAELEFSALLALKEATARERGRRDQAGVCSQGARLFLRDHFGRWAENIGRRVAITAHGTAYASFGRLLAAFAEADIRQMRPGPIVPYQEVPNPREELDDGSCPAEEGLGVAAEQIMSAVPAGGPAFASSGKAGD
jgi:DMSO reductase family type II enzyme chaperone